MKTSLESLGETALIKRLTACLRHEDDVTVGPGDDCAVIALPGNETDLVFTSDPVIEGRHFRPGTPPRQIGHKGVGRVLSDLAAMGATPRWGLVDIVAPPDMDVALLVDVYRGMQSLADAHAFSIVGGDVARGSPFSLHVFGTGTVPRGCALLRSGATSGEAIFVTGELGGSIQARHLCFEPRVAEGIWLRNWATAVIDISDGLATDLRHLCESSRTGARIALGAVPVSDAVRACDDGRSPIEHALEDGEDFELLFTVPMAKADALERAWNEGTELRCTRIGTMTPEGSGIVCVASDGTEQPLESTGYDHFAG